MLTLGCFRNEVESDLLRDSLFGLGLAETPLEGADIIVVNTCGFIEDAVNEGIDTILELDRLAAKLERRPPILVVGCMGQRYGEELLQEMPEISGVLGVDWVDNLRNALGTILSGERFQACSRTPSPVTALRCTDSSENSTMFVRIADGCSRSCRFCYIPFIRGAFKSRPPEEILEEIERLAGGKEREVVLLAQDLTSYGKDQTGGLTLASLARKVTEMDKVKWLRLLYMQPEGVTVELMEEITGNPKICDYFDIPFQHASPNVLNRMGRPGNAVGYLALIDSIRDRSPDAALRTTVMVGYPGESKRDFDLLLRFIDQVKFDWMGAFRFSAEAGTRAAGLRGNISYDTAQIRYDRVVALQGFIEEERVGSLIGRELEVLIDGVSEMEGYDFVGRSYREAPVVDGVIYLRKLTGTVNATAIGGFARARITGQEGLDLVGEI